MRAMSLLCVWATIASTVAAAGASDDTGAWSEPKRDIEARVTLAEKPRVFGTRLLVPYLELRNVGESRLQVRCSDQHVKFELVDAQGKVIRDGWALPRSGAPNDPGTLSLPRDSSIRVNMHCSNWGVPTDAAVFIATDSGAWAIAPEEKGNVFLRATIQGSEVRADPGFIWHGRLETPLIKVDWAE